MKKLLFLLLALCSTLCARVLDEQGQPLPPLLSLFEVLGIPYEHKTESFIASAEKN